jgi:ABC-type multidrug transport system permease subunit
MSYRCLAYVFISSFKWFFLFILLLLLFFVAVGLNLVSHAYLATILPLESLLQPLRFLFFEKASVNEKAWSTWSKQHAIGC